MESKTGELEKFAAVSEVPVEKRSRWFERLSKWCRLKRLHRELRNSEKFQKECEELRCFHLASLERQYREKVAAEIKRLE